MDGAASVPDSRPMTLSVIITTKNNASTIRECVQRVLDAPPKDKEVLIVYGRSKDGTEQIIQEYKDRVLIHEDNVGTGSAINTGVFNSKGSIIFFVEGHSFASRTIFTKALETFKKDNKTGYVVFRRYVPPDFRGNKVQELLSLWRRVTHDQRGAPSVVGQFRAFRRETFFDVGGFWIFPKGADDLEFATRVVGKGWGMAVLEDPSWDLPRRSYEELFKHELKKGSSEYMWYQTYKNAPYALLAYGSKGHCLKKPSRIVFYNIFIRRILFAPYYAVKMAWQYREPLFIPFFLGAMLARLSGFVYAFLFWRGKQMWMKKRIDQTC